MMTINFDVTSQTAMATVMTHKDAIEESDEDIFVDLKVPDGASKPQRISICTGNTAIVVVKDVPSPGVPNVVVCWDSPSISIDEDDGFVELGVRVSEEHMYPIQVNVSCSPGTAEGTINLYNCVCLCVRVYMYVCAWVYMYTCELLPCQRRLWTHFA